LVGLFQIIIKRKFGFNQFICYNKGVKQPSFFMDKIDTQGMSFPGKSKKPSSYEPMPVKIRTIFTPQERVELKQIINEALDEREKA
jgi:hypothetical protein